MPPGAGHHHHSARRLATLLAVCVVVSACSGGKLKNRPPAWQTAPTDTRPAATTFTNTARDVTTTGGAAQTAGTDSSFYRPGNDRTVRRPRIADARVQPDGDIKLNFQNANLLEVVKVILGDMLGVTYVVDPAVKGSVSMQTATPLGRADLVPTLELLLRMNNAALVTDGGIYRVLPLANAVTSVRAPQLGDSSLPLPQGFSVRLVPLRYVAAGEMVQILEPFLAGSNQILRVDSRRNLLILAGTGGDMERLLETIYVFDVDQMKGMSVALFTPDFVDAKTLAEELRKLLADPEKGLLGDVVRFITVDRLNALIVVTPRAEQLARVREWIERLDRDGGGTGRRLFIYRVQNGEATELADMLGQLFEPDSARRKLPAAEVAPGLTPRTVGQVEAKPAPAAALRKQMPAGREAAAEKAGDQAAAAGDGLNINTDSQVRFIADEPNNALLILASAREYRQIQAALKQLDVSPMQVLVEVTIAEVTLKDNLEYGVEWFFKHGVGSSDALGTLDLGTLGLNALAPGFSYAIQGTDNVVKAVLNTLDRESNLSIISSPALLVLNNQEATIQVGDEVPVSTQQQQPIPDTADPDVTRNIVNTIEYRDTGILLKVKPRINASGLVIMDVEQEASLVPLANNPDPLTPRIQQRKIKSTVAVNSGDTIILGGLIQDNHDKSEAGIPGLHQVPLFGALFGTKADSKGRTELLVLITPRAVPSRLAALQVTEEFRRKLHSLVPLEERGGFLSQRATPAEARAPQQPGPARLDEAGLAPDTTPARAPAAVPKSSVKRAPVSVAKPPPAGPAQRAPSKPPAMPANTVCERVGPFPERARAEALAGQLRGSYPAVRLKNIRQDIWVGHRVTIPAYDTLAEAEQALAALKKAGFGDALLYKVGPSTGSIALGVFSKQANVKRISARLLEAGYPVDVSDATRPQDQYWIAIRRAPDDTVPVNAWMNTHKLSDLSQVPFDCAAFGAN